jgi:hypothetical protein
MSHADGWMGRRLWSAFQSTQLFDGNILARVLINTEFAPPWYGHARLLELRHLVNEGLFDREECERLLAAQQALAAQASFFYSITGYAYLGKRRAT